MRTIHLQAALAGLAALLADRLAQSRTVVRVSNGDELRRALAAARPGTRVLVAPGEYEGFFVSDLHGASGQPIVVEALDPAHPPRVNGGVQLSEVSELEFGGFVIRGAPANGLNIDDGGSFETPAHHVLVRDVRVEDCGRRGNEDGIKLSGLDDFRLERCTVERWGRGGSAIDMVGCHRGLVVDCTLRDREDDPATSGLQLKGGTRAVVVRATRFEHAGERAINLGGATDLRWFRPKPEGFEAREITVEGCTFVGSEAPIACVGADGAVLRFNTFYRPRKWFLRILQETRASGFVPCRNVEYTDNLVAWRSDEIATPVNIGPATEPGSFVFARNYWFCIDHPEFARPALPTAEKDPAGGADPRFADAAAGDFTLAAGSPARGHGAGALPEQKR